MLVERPPVLHGRRTCMAQATTAPSDYPVQLTITDERTLSRWWGIPYFGMVVRFILLIPHLVVMAVLGIGMYVVLLVGWIPILLTGRVPALQAKWIKETIHRSTRVTGYGPYLMPGGYPPLGVCEVGPTDLRIDTSATGASTAGGESRYSVSWPGCSSPFRTSLSCP
jgi:hypothetical protein